MSPLLSYPPKKPGTSTAEETGKPIETGIVQDSGRGPECLVTGGGPEEEESSESRHPLARFCGRCQRYVITFGNPNDLKYQVTDQEGRALAFRIERWNAWTDLGHPDIGSE